MSVPRNRLRVLLDRAEQMKPDLPIKKVSAKLDILRFDLVVETPPRARCLNCSAPLSLSQPDLKSPDRLLGICGQCRHWFLIDLVPDSSAGILCRLPDIEVIRSLSHENPSAGISVMGDEGDKRSAGSQQGQ